MTEPDPDALLTAERSVPPVPDALRERLRARITETLSSPTPVAATPTAVTPKLLLLLGGLASVVLVTVAVFPHPPAPTPTPTLAPTPTPAPTPAPDSPPPTSTTPHTPATPPTSTTPAPTRLPTAPHRDPTRERALLDRAQSALADGDPAAALARLRDHQREFPRGALTEEREALRVHALTKSDQRDAAQRAADAFRARYPRSIHRGLVDALAPARPAPFTPEPPAPATPTSEQR